MGQIKLIGRFIVFIGILIPWVNISVFSHAITDFNPKSTRGFPFEDNRQLHPSYGSGVNGEHARAAIKSMECHYEKYSVQRNVEEANCYRVHDPEDKSIYMSNQYFNDHVISVAPSTHTFLEKIIDEIKIMYQESGAPLPAIHMAGDELPHGSWEMSPAELPS